MDTTDNKGEPEATPSSETEEWLSIRAAAKETGIKETTVRGWVKNQKVSSRKVMTKFGEQVEVRPSELEEVADSQPRPVTRGTAPAAKPAPGQPEPVAGASLEKLTTFFDGIRGQLHEAGHKQGIAETTARFQTERVNELLRRLRDSEERAARAENRAQSLEEINDDLKGEVAELKSRLERGTDLTDEEINAALERRTEPPNRGVLARLLGH